PEDAHDLAVDRDAPREDERLRPPARCDAAPSEQLLEPLACPLTRRGRRRSWAGHRVRARPAILSTPPRPAPPRRSPAARRRARPGRAGAAAPPGRGG